MILLNPRGIIPEHRFKSNLIIAEFGHKQKQKPKKETSPWKTHKGREIRELGTGGNDNSYYKHNVKGRGEFCQTGGQTRAGPS